MEKNKMDRTAEELEALQTAQAEAGTEDAGHRAGGPGAAVF